MFFFFLAGTWESHAKIILHTNSSGMSLSPWMDLNETLVAVHVAYDTNQRVVLMAEEHWPSILVMSFEYKWSSRNYMDIEHVSWYAYHYTRDTMQFSRAWIRNIPTDAYIAILLWRVKVDTAVAWQGNKRGHDVAVWHCNGNSNLSSLLWPW